MKNQEKTPIRDGGRSLVKTKSEADSPAVSMTLSQADKELERTRTGMSEIVKPSQQVIQEVLHPKAKPDPKSKQAKTRAAAKTRPEPKPKPKREPKAKTKAKAKAASPKPKASRKAKAKTQCLNSDSESGSD